MCRSGDLFYNLVSCLLELISLSRVGSGTTNQSSSYRQSSGGHQQRYQTPASALYSGGSDHQRTSYSSGSSREPVQGKLADLLFSLASLYSQRICKYFALWDQDCVLSCFCAIVHVTERYSQQSHANDSVAMMEFYMKKAAQEALRRPPKQSKDEMPPPPGLHPPPPGSGSFCY